MGIKKSHLVVRVAALVALLLAGAPQTDAAVIGYTSSTYTQDFDTLANTGTPSWSNGNTLPGWFAVIESNVVPTTYTVTNGGAATQNQLLSIGTTGSTDRALGSQNQNTPAAAKTMRYGVALSNSNAYALREFSLTYTGEQWRVITGETVQDKLTFSYQIFPAGTGSLTAGTWTDVTSLDFTAPAPFPASVSMGLDGNLSANRATLSQTVTGINWTPGSELWLRWTDSNTVTGNERRSMMGVDDVSFSAIPEPGTISLLAASVLAVGYTWRRKSRREL